MNNTAVGYVRTSTIEQASDGASIDAQERLIKKYCTQNGLRLLEVFFDTGFIGRQALFNEELDNAIELACKNKAIFIVYSLSKMAHSAKNAIKIVNSLKESGANLICITDSWDTTTNEGKYIFKILEDLARFEREAISWRTKETLAIKKMNGEFSGQPPYGMFRGKCIGVNDAGKFIYELRENPVESEVMRLIAKLRTEGSSFNRIAEHLNLLGLKTRRKTKWKTDRVWQIYQSIISRQNQ